MIQSLPVPPLLQTTLLTTYDQTFRGVARRIFKSRHNMIEERSMRVKRVKAPGESKVEPLYTEGPGEGRLNAPLSATSLISWK